MKEGSELIPVGDARRHPRAWYRRLWKGTIDAFVVRYRAYQ